MKKISLVFLTLFPALSMATTVNGTKTDSDLLLKDSKNSLSQKIEKRLDYEEESDKNPFSLTTHKMNYILPYTYSENINTSVYSEIEDFNLSESFKNEEIKFQLSVKFPILKSIFKEEDKLYFGFTMKSFWQIYAAEASRPFRNTDYNPEIFYMTKISEIGDRDNFLMFGLEHESNGQVQYLSRSWNRIYATIETDCDDYAIALKTWYRIPEDEKTEAFSPKGDDNPDIGDYYGNAELSVLWNYSDFQYTALGRHNFSTGKGYLELGVTFPLYDNLKGYAQFVNGYGETLLDYNFYQRRIGVGIVFSDIF